MTPDTTPAARCGRFPTRGGLMQRFADAINDAIGGMVPFITAAIGENP